MAMVTVKFGLKPGQREKGTMKTVTDLSESSCPARQPYWRPVLAFMTVLACLGPAGQNPAPAAVTSGASVSASDYVVIGWNDLGMHCINPSFKSLAILPPNNNLWVQVIKRGDPPTLITDPNFGLTVEYSIPGNTQVEGKTDF
jgi:hypothetical protein